MTIALCKSGKTFPVAPNFVFEIKVGTFVKARRNFYLSFSLILKQAPQNAQKTCGYQEITVNDAESKPERYELRPNELDAKRLSMVRGALGLTQRDLSKLLGCDKRTIYNYENAISPIPRERSRSFGEIAKVDIAPFDPNEDPYLTVRQHYDMQQAKTLSATSSSHEKPRLISKFVQLRTYTDFHNQYILSPMRRACENALRITYLCATLTFAVEKFQRDLGGWSQHHAYHDTQFIASFVLIALLFLPTLQTIPWGTNPSDRRNQRRVRDVRAESGHSLRMQNHIRLSPKQPFDRQRSRY